MGLELKMEMLGFAMRWAEKKIIFLTKLRLPITAR